MIIDREHPLPEDIYDRVHRALKSPRLTKEEKEELKAMLGFAMMMSAACKLMCDDLDIR